MVDEYNNCISLNQIKSINVIIIILFTFQLILHPNQNNSENCIDRDPFLLQP